MVGMKYVFTRAQFSALMVLSGVTKLYTFPLDQELPREKLIAALHALYQKGAAVSDGNTLAPEPELGRLLSTAGRAERTVLLTDVSGEFPQHQLWSAGEGELVVLERCRTESEDTFKLCSASDDRFLEDLFENELGDPEKPGEPREMLRVEWADAAGEPMRRMSVQVLDGGVWMLLQDREGERLCLPCSREEFRTQFLKGWEENSLD